MIALDSEIGKTQIPSLAGQFDGWKR